MATTKPPFYWKVPAAEKDYMFENVQRIRRTAAQNKSKEPVKATFIPGVTKNSKYAHITSRVGDFMRSSSVGRRGEGDEYGNSNGRSGDNTKQVIQRHQSTATQNPRRNLDRQLSRSSTDLMSRRRSRTGSDSGEGAASAPILRSSSKASRIDSQGPPGNYVPRAKRKPKGLQIEDESVYNWRFSENAPSHLGGGGGGGLVRKSQSDSKIQGFHRVEYLPCDGICAEETLVESPDGSGRCSSRTSRGMNTEETRIIEDFQHLDIQADTSEQRPPISQSPVVVKYEDNSGMNSQNHINGASRNVLPSDFKSKNQNPTQTLPHNLGTVPRYLKQRQEEWKLQAEQVAAAVSAADVPPGHVLLPEAERLETLQGLKTTYANLIDELNRVPIRIDTIRVREHKIKLEQQLQKLERGMTIFSRPRVYVKLPEDGTVDYLSQKAST